MSGSGERDPRFGAVVAVLPGDGVGPEVCDAAMAVLKIARPDLELRFGAIGATAHEREGAMLPETTVELVRESDAIFVGALGTPEWSEVELSERPEQALLWLRRELELFACLRPVATWSPVRFNGVQLPQPLWIFRELTAGLYYGQPRGIESTNGRRRGYDTDSYTEEEVRRFARFVLGFAAERSARVLNVDKANVMYSSSLWRDVVKEVHRDECPDVEVDHMHVDAAAFELLRRPADWQVVLASNLFGDILSDELGIFSGSIGMLPSASLGEREPFLYEPVHGSAPTLVGRDVANPCGAILSAAMLCRWTLADVAAADRIESAVTSVLQTMATPDLGGSDSDSAVTAAICSQLERTGSGGG